MNGNGRTEVALHIIHVFRDGAATGQGIVKLPAALDAKQMAAMNLVFLSNEVSSMTGSMLYVYGPAAASVKVKAESSIRSPGKKSKREQEDEEEEEEE